MTTDVDFTNTGRALIPWCPVHLISSHAGGDRTLQWTRRSRINGTWHSGTDIPLGEAVEQYQVIVYTDNTYATAALTYIATTEEQVAPDADLIAAFGSSHVDLYWSVAQLGALGYGDIARAISEYVP